MIDPALAEALGKVDKPTQKLLKNVIYYEPVQKMLMTFLSDTSRSFEEWIWDPKTREVLSRLQNLTVHTGPQAVREDPTLIDTYEDALVNGIQSMDSASIASAAEVAKAAGKKYFIQKNYEAALNAYRKAADLLKTQEEYHGDALSSLYQTCCTNAAICAMKLELWPTVREFAQSALARNPRDGKSLYCLAKILLVEQRYDESRDAIEKALQLNPEDKLCLKVLQDIDKIREREVARVTKETEVLRIESERLRNEEEERRSKLPPAADYLKPRIVPLPHPTDLGTSSSILNMYFSQSKENHTIDYYQLHDSGNGDPPSFKCIITNHSTNTQLAVAQAPNKKKAQMIASEIAIMKMWYDRREAKLLLPDDKIYLNQHPDINSKLDTIDFSISHEESLNLQTKLLTYTCAIPEMPASMIPVSYLSQLHIQGKLHFEYRIEDKSDQKNNIQLFEVEGILNGRVVAKHACPSKKAAKKVIAEEALQVAIRESHELYPDQTDESVADCQGDKPEF